MSKTKSRNASETEHLRGVNRKLESENRQLKRRLKEMDRKSHYFEEIVDEVADDVELKASCPLCNKGTLAELDFKFVILTKCDHCTYQKTRKNK